MKNDIINEEIKFCQKIRFRILPVLFGFILFYLNHTKEFSFAANSDFLIPLSY